MAGGPYFFHSAVPAVVNLTFPNIHQGAGGNSNRDEGLGVAASLASDAIWQLRFQLPPLLPSGVPKLLLRALANAAAGSAKVNPKCAKVGPNENPSTAALTALGTQTLTWAAGDNDKYKDALVDLSTLNIAPADVKKELVMDLVFESVGWTLAQVSTWIPSLIWE